jgi:hypothetical protein
MWSWWRVVVVVVVVWWRVPDHVFPPDTSNQQVFEVVAENVIWSTMEGFNGTCRRLHQHRVCAVLCCAVLC